MRGQRRHAAMRAAMQTSLARPRPTERAASSIETVDIGQPQNALYPVETADDFNLRVVQRNQRDRRRSQ